MTTTTPSGSGSGSGYKSWTPTLRFPPTIPNQQQKPTPVPSKARAPADEPTIVSDDDDTAFPAVTTVRTTTSVSTTTTAARPAKPGLSLLAHLEKTKGIIRSTKAAAANANANVDQKTPHPRPVPLKITTAKTPAPIPVASASASVATPVTETPSPDASVPRARTRSASVPPVAASPAAAAAPTGDTTPVYTPVPSPRGASASPAVSPAPLSATDIEEALASTPVPNDDDGDDPEDEDFTVKDDDGDDDDGSDSDVDDDGDQPGSEVQEITDKEFKKRPLMQFECPSDDESRAADAAVAVHARTRAMEAEADYAYAPGLLAHKQVLVENSFLSGDEDAMKHASAFQNFKSLMSIAPRMAFEEYEHCRKTTRPNLPEFKLLDFTNGVTHHVVKGEPSPHDGLCAYDFHRATSATCVHCESLRKICKLYDLLASGKITTTEFQGRLAASRKEHNSLRRAQIKTHTTWVRSLQSEDKKRKDAAKSEAAAKAVAERKAALDQVKKDEEDEKRREAEAEARRPPEERLNEALQQAAAHKGALCCSRYHVSTDPASLKLFECRRCDAEGFKTTTWVCSHAQRRNPLFCEECNRRRCSFYVKRNGVSHQKAKDRFDELYAPKPEPVAEKPKPKAKASASASGSGTAGSAGSTAVSATDAKFAALEKQIEVLSSMVKCVVQQQQHSGSKRKATDDTPAPDAAQAPASKKSVPAPAPASASCSCAATPCSHTVRAALKATGLSDLVILKMINAQFSKVTSVVSP